MFQQQRSKPERLVTGAGNAAHRIYSELRQHILDMNLLPGMRIVEKDIAATHGVSRTPVHEAVHRLTEEGLLEVMPRVGTYVARIPLDRLNEAMLVRTALEVAVVRRAVLQITPLGLAHLQRILADQEICVEHNDELGFHRSDEVFHETLATIAGFPGVWRMVLQAKTQIDRYRRLTLPMPGRMQGVVAEHREVVARLEAGHQDHAAAAMREHLDQVLPLLEVTRMHQPDYFIAHLPDKAELVTSW